MRSTIGFRLVYRDRRYVFCPIAGKRVVVKRYEPLNGGLKSSMVYTTGKARWLWKKLHRLGYSQ